VWRQGVEFDERKVTATIATGEAAVPLQNLHCAFKNNLDGVVISTAPYYIRFSAAMPDSC
jgi:hypothetical protein